MQQKIIRNPSYVMLISFALCCFIAGKVGNRVVAFYGKPGFIIEVKLLYARVETVCAELLAENAISNHDSDN